MNETNVKIGITNSSVTGAFKNVQSIQTMDTLPDKTNEATAGMVCPLKRHFQGSVRSAKSSDSKSIATNDCSTKDCSTPGSTETSQKIKRRFVQASKKLRFEHQEHLQKVEDAEKRKQDLENLSKAIREKNSRRGSFGRKATNPVAPRLSYLNRSSMVDERKSSQMKDSTKKQHSVSISEIFRKSRPNPNLVSSSKSSNSTSQFPEPKQKYRPEEIKAYIELKKVKLAKQKRQETKQNEEMRRHRNDQIRLAEEFHKKGAVAYRRMLERKKKRSRPSPILEMDVSNENIRNSPPKPQIIDPEPEFLPQKVLVTDGSNLNTPSNSTFDDDSMSAHSLNEELSYLDEQNRFADRIRKIKESAGRLVLRVSKYTQDKPLINMVSTEQSTLFRATENQPSLLNTFETDAVALAQTDDVKKDSQSNQSVPAPDPDETAMISNQGFSDELDISIRSQDLCSVNEKPESEIGHDSLYSEGVADIDSLSSAPSKFEKSTNDKEPAVKVDWNIFGKPVPQFRPNPLSIVNVFATRFLDRKEEIILDGEREDSFVIPRPPAGNRNAIRAFSRSPKLRFTPSLSQSGSPGSPLDRKHQDYSQSFPEKIPDGQLSDFQACTLTQNLDKKGDYCSESDYSPTEESINDTETAAEDDPSERTSSTRCNVDQSEGLEENSSRLSPRSLALEATASLRYLDEIYEAKAEIRELECSYKIQSEREATTLPSLEKNVVMIKMSAEKSCGVESDRKSNFSESDDCFQEETKSELNVSQDCSSVANVEPSFAPSDDQNRNMQEPPQPANSNDLAEVKFETSGFRDVWPDDSSTKKAIAETCLHSGSANEDHVESSKEAELVLQQTRFQTERSVQLESSSDEVSSSYASCESEKRSKLEDNLKYSQELNFDFDQTAPLSNTPDQSKSFSDTYSFPDCNFESRIGSNKSGRSSNSICSEIEFESESTLTKSQDLFEGLDQNNPDKSQIKSSTGPDGTHEPYLVSKPSELSSQSIYELGTCSDNCSSSAHSISELSHFKLHSAEPTSLSDYVSSHSSFSIETVSALQNQNALRSELESGSYSLSSFETDSTDNVAPMITSYVDGDVPEKSKLVHEDPDRNDFGAPVHSRNVSAKSASSLESFESDQNDADSVQNTPGSLSDSFARNDSHASQLSSEPYCQVGFGNRAYSEISNDEIVKRFEDCRSGEDQNVSYDAPQQNDLSEYERARIYSDILQEEIPEQTANDNASGSPGIGFLSEQKRADGENLHEVSQEEILERTSGEIHQDKYDQDASSEQYSDFESNDNEAVRQESATASFTEPLKNGSPTVSALDIPRTRVSEPDEIASISETNIAVVKFGLENEVLCSIDSNRLLQTDITSGREAMEAADDLILDNSEVRDPSVAVSSRAYTVESKSHYSDAKTVFEAKATECEHSSLIIPSSLSESFAFSKIEVDNEVSVSQKCHSPKDTEGEPGRNILSNYLLNDANNLSSPRDQLNEKYAAGIESAQKSQFEDSPLIPENGDASSAISALPNTDFNEAEVVTEEMSDNGCNSSYDSPKSSEINDILECSDNGQADNLIKVAISGVKISGSKDLSGMEESRILSHSQSKECEHSKSEAKTDLVDVITKAVFDDLIKEFEFLDFDDAQHKSNISFPISSFLSTEQNVTALHSNVSEEEPEPQRNASVIADERTSDVADQLAKTILDDLVNELQNTGSSSDSCPYQHGLTAGRQSCAGYASSELRFPQVEATIKDTELHEEADLCSELKSKSEKADQITNAILSDLVTELHISADDRDVNPNPLTSFDVNNPECTKAYISTILSSQGSIEWNHPIIKKDLFEVLESQQTQKDLIVASFQRFVFDMLQSVLFSLRPYGDHPPPESWHLMKPRKLSTRFWREPSQNEIIKEVMSRIFPDPSSLYDNVDEIVNSQVRKEEWYFDEHIADVQFEIADLIFNEILQDSIHEIVQV